MKAVQNPDLIRHGEGSLRTQSSMQTASILSNMRTKVTGFQREVAS